jgi:GT2 family glycosyltransferase
MTNQTGGQGKLVAVVVTYNRLDQLKLTLARLLEAAPEHLDAVVVVDNASTDGTADWLSTQDDPRLDLFRCETNGGGAAGFDHGMRRAVAAHDPDWVVVMDDDGRPQSGAFAAFHELDLQDWDAIAAAVYYPDGTICDMNRPSRNPFWHGSVFLKTVLRLGGRGGFHLTPDDYSAKTPRPIDITSFVGFFISRAGIVRAGYPDPDLFVYGDDGIYTLKLRKQGGRIAFEPRVKFEHDCSTFSETDMRFRPMWKVYYYHRNLLMLYRRAAGLLFWPLLLVVVPKWLLKTRDHKGERVLFLRLLGRAIRDGLLERTGTDHVSLLRDVD